MSGIFISRQPILDRSMKIFAYELEFNQGLSPTEKHIDATRELIVQTEKEVCFKEIVGDNTAMISLPKELINVETVSSLALSSNIVLEIPNNILKDSTVLNSLKEVKASGSAIALENFTDDDSSVKLAGISEFAKIDNEEYSDAKLRKMVNDLHEKGLKVIAETVETEEMFNYLKKLGFDYFKGHFFTNPVIINGEKLSGNRLSLLQLMAKVNDPETDFHELTQIVSQDVALSHKLLLAINKPAANIPVKVENINDALRYMGLKRLKFWVNMLLLGQLDDVPQELMTTSLIRAKFCEQVAEKSGHNSDKDSYFLVGLFSALGAFFKTPIEDIVPEMPLSEEVITALLTKKGSMGKALFCLIKIEMLCANTDYSTLNYEGLSLTELSSIYLNSTAWAQKAMGT